MPKKLASAQASAIGVKKIVVGVGAGVAFVAALIANFQTISDFFTGTVLAPSNVKVGWLTVGDPATLKNCVFGEDSNVFKLADNQQVKLASTACLTDLRSRLAEDIPADIPSPQKIQASYFLLVENQGDQIERLRLKSATDLGGQDMVFRDLEKGASVAICMGYDGNAGNPSRMESVAKLVVQRNASLELDIDVPSKTEGTPVGVSNCGNIVWNYPE
ncbi:hypothetical protein D3C77_264140 [compost metagenome]